jgi:hypothetical protein
VSQSSHPVIDIHVHIQPWWQLRPDVAATMAKGRAQYDELLLMMRQPARFLKLMDTSGIERAGLITTWPPISWGSTIVVSLSSSMPKPHPTD